MTARSVLISTVPTGPKAEGKPSVANPSISTRMPPETTVTRSPLGCGLESIAGDESFRGDIRMLRIPEGNGWTAFTAGVNSVNCASVNCRFGCGSPTPSAQQGTANSAKKKASAQHDRSRAERTESEQRDGVRELLRSLFLATSGKRTERAQHAAGLFALTTLIFGL